MQRLIQMNRKLRHPVRSNLTQTFSKKRKWALNKDYLNLQSSQATTDAPSAIDESNLVKIMSYNILADNNIRQFLFKGRRLSDISFKNRKKNLLKEISTSNADIICLQEVEDIHSSYIAKYFKKRRYDSYFKRKADPLKADGCMILWKSERFRLVEQCWGSLGVEAGINYFAADLSIVSISEVLEDLDKERQMRLRNGHPLFVQRAAPKSFNNRFIGFADEMYYHSLVIFALLEDKRTRSKSLVVTTHLLFNSKRGHLKLSQLVIIFKAIEMLKSKHEIENVFFCGDFNFVPNSALYHYISNHQFDVKALLNEYSNQNLLVKNNYKTVENIVAIADMKYEFNKGPYSLSGFNRSNETGLDYSLHTNFKFLESLVSLEVMFSPSRSGERELVYYNDLSNRIVREMYRDIEPELAKKEKQELMREALSRKLNQLAFRMNFKSSYSFVNESIHGKSARFNRDCKVTQYGDHIKVPVDYIWFTRDSRCRPVGVLEVPQEGVLENMKKSLPYREFGSDHFSISAIFDHSK